MLSHAKALSERYSDPHRVTLYSPQIYARRRSAYVSCSAAQRPNRHARCSRQDRGWRSETSRAPFGKRDGEIGPAAAPSRQAVPDIQLGRLPPRRHDRARGGRANPTSATDAGIFVLRDDPQGRRWGRCGPDNRIIEAYGFDLSPLAQRADEFIWLASARRQEREAAKALRKRKAVARRAIRQAGETLADLGEMPEG